MGALEIIFSALLKVWIDYRNKKIMLKKNGSFKGGFEYIMSGIEVVYNGKVLVEEKQLTPADTFGKDTNNSISIIANYTYKFKPSYRVQEILLNSPAYKAGVREEVMSFIN